MIPLNALGVGFARGLMHAAEPGHIATIGTLLERGSSVRVALRVGALWGLGHALTLLASGLALLVLGVRVPESLLRAAQWGVVGLMVLFALQGLWQLARTRGERLDKHHDHHDEEAPTLRRSGLRAVVVGALHGLSGSMGVALLAVATIRTRFGAGLYVLLLASGALLGMTALTAALGASLRALHRWPRLADRWLPFGACVLGLLVAAGLAVRLASGGSLEG